MVNGSYLFIIDIGPHPLLPSGPTFDWLEILDAHGPEQLTALTCVIPGRGPFGETDHQRMRDAGVVTCVTLRSGRTLAPPGGGYSTSGDATKARMRMNRFRKGLHHLERTLSEKGRGTCAASLLRSSLSHCAVPRPKVTVAAAPLPQFGATMSTRPARKVTKSPVAVQPASPCAGTTID